MQTKILQFQVTKVLPEVYRLQWDSSQLLPDDTIAILRSESGYTGFEPVGPVFKAYVTDQYYDQLFEYIKTPYYRLRITRGNDAFLAPENNEEGIFATVPLSTIVLQRRKHLSLNYEHSGVQVLFYKKRTVGMKCPYCTDVSTGKRLISNCIHCFGTGFIGGYLPPVMLHVLIGRPREYKGQSQIGQIETDAVQIHIPGWVEPFPGDVIRTPDNTMYEITNKRNTITFQQGVIKYAVLAVEVEPHSAVYNLSIPEQPTAVKFTLKTAIRAWK